jgi:undecaprenyl-diphosphatase
MVEVLDSVGGEGSRASSGRPGHAARLVPDRSWITAALVGLGVMSLIAVVANGWLLTVDEPLSTFARVASIQGFARVLSQIGGTEIAIAVTVALSAVLWRRCRTSSLAIPITIAVGALANVVLKQAIGRPRPPDPSTGTALASFPSGHTFQATLLLGLLPLAVLLLTQRHDLVRWARVGAGVGIAAVAASRVVLGAHWPTDVIAGFLVGLALLEVTHLLLARSHRRTTDCACPLSVAVRT